MAEALKNSFGPDIPRRIAAMIEAVQPQRGARHLLVLSDSELNSNPNL